MARPSQTPLRTCSVVLVRTKDWPQGIRLLVTPEGIFHGLVSYFGSPRNLGRSGSWQGKCARALGLLYDYLAAIHKLDPPPTPAEQLSRFVQALTNGTVQLDGTDPADLFWRPAPLPVVREVVQALNSFADYCASEFSLPSANPLVAADFGTRIANLRRLDRVNRNSLLKHLGPSPSSRAGTQAMRQVRAPRAPKISAARPPYFPFDKFEPLLTNGFRIKKSQPDSWATWSLRDMLIAILQRHGGVRASEAFHLFVTDVREDPRLANSAEVRLYHPELGRFSHRDPVKRAVVHPSRSEYLQKTYGRLPRTLIAGAEYAGWKDLMLDIGVPDYYATVRWFPGEWGMAFWSLYQLYVKHVLPQGLNHPYLFVTLDKGPQYGSPYRLGSYKRNLASAMRRIDLTVDKDLGTTSHGLRHAYGQSLERAGVGIKIIQNCMHHQSPMSQEVYTRPEREMVHAALEAAKARLQGHLSSISLPQGLPLLTHSGLLNSHE